MARRTPVVFYAGTVAVILSAGLFYKTINRRHAPRQSPVPYESVEALLQDHKTAFEQAPGAAARTIRLARDYFICRALKAGSEDLCSGVETLDTKPPEGNISHCRDLVLEALAVKEALGGGTAMDARVKWWRLSENTAAPEEIAGEHRAWADSVRKGDPNTFCAKVMESGGAEHSGPEALAECLEEFTYIVGDPDRCPESRGAECRLKSRLIKALKEHKPGLAAGSMYAPLFIQDASCKPLGDKVLAAYGEGTAAASRALPPGRSYDSVEALLRDHKTAFRRAPKSAEKTLRLSRNYLVCKALKIRSDTPCSSIDALGKKRSMSTCKEMYQEGLDALEDFSDGPAASACANCTPEEAAAAEADIEERRAWAETMRRGDLNGICALSQKMDPDYSGPEGFANCLRQHVYIAGDPSRCPESQGAECRSKARMIKVFREQKPELAAGSMYAPLFLKNASCKPLADKALAAYGE